MIHTLRQEAVLAGRLLFLVIDKKKMFFSASAADVARFALRKFLKTNQPSAIYGFWNKLMIYAERVSPRRLTVFVTGLMYRSQEQPKAISSKS